MHKQHILAIVFFIAALALTGQAAAAPDAVAALEKKVRSYTSFKADFVQTLTHRQSGTTETRQGSIIFRKPDSLRWETVHPSRELIVVTDSAVWNYIPDEEVAYKYPLDILKDSDTIMRFITGRANLDSDFEIEVEEEQGSTRIHLYPYHPQQTLTEAVLWVDTQSGELKKVAVTDFYGNENMLEFSDMQFDIESGTGSFSFSPPAGTDIEDRTSDKVMEKKLFQ
jgi:outer membrane lipoprotein carrier protein